MAYPEFAEHDVTPVFDSMMEQNLLKHKMFSFYLTAADQKHDSELTFGYYDKTKFEGEIAWHDAVYRMMFGVVLDDVLIDGKSMGWCGPDGKKEKCLITVDSGTSYMSLPSFAYKDIENTIPTVSKGISCSSPEQFGEITYVISGVNYTMQASEWIYPPTKTSIFPRGGAKLADANAQLEHSNRVVPHALVELEEQAKKEKTLIELGQSKSSVSLTSKLWKAL